MTVKTTLGELIQALYEEFLKELGDEELAEIATSATLADMMARE